MHIQLSSWLATCNWQLFTTAAETLKENTQENMD